MRTSSSRSSFLFAFFLMFSCYSTTTTVQPSDFPKFPTANLTTRWNQNEIYANYYRPVSNNGIIQDIYAKILLHRNTNEVQFACGFYCTSPCTSFLFVILISSDLTDEDKTPQVVWSANRDHLVNQNAVLNFTIAGELVLWDSDGTIAWTAGKSVTSMNLTETGNLVLFDDQDSVVWQSFDYPTDCLLPGQKLFEGQQLTSSASLLNDSTGMYSLRVTDSGLVAHVESNPPQAYLNKSFIPYGNNTKKEKSYVQFFNGSLSFHINSSETGGVDVPLGISQASSAQYMKLMSDGHLKVFEWQSEEWTVVTDLTSTNECRFPLFCGKNSICSANQCSCPTIKFFRPVSDHQPNLGCSEITPLACNSTQDQDFITLENVTYFTPTADLMGVDEKACKQACLNNCSCKAAFFKIYRGKCFLPSELFTMRSDPYDDRARAFIKVQKVARSPPLSHRVTAIVGSTIGSVVLLLIVVTTYVVHKRKRDLEMEEEYLEQVPGMPTRFTYEELKTATENFGKKLGEGGFGSVFEGCLKDGSKIAVKCLEGLSHIKKSFLAEVQSIGSIHHVNLVRLRGFCTWKSQQFLVYDFMSNGSLDRWIYPGVRDHILEWECRKKIILDIAKGLAYLHEECRQKIIHLDIKPQNILLDNNFNAKVSDFGLSRLIDKSQTEVVTTIKGTPGYIAPEWRSSIISEKMDVYSFGVVLLEILCGRKVFDRSQSEESQYLLFVFEKCWEQGTLSEMVDRHSEDMQAHGTEVVEMMKVASWCLQTNFKRRPSMTSVVKVLGGMNVEPNLDYNFTDLRIQETTFGDEKDFTNLSASLLSGPR